jgi:hypothetical protein
MTIRKPILSALALSSIVLAAGTGASLAGGTKTFAPGQGVTVQADNQHGVGYFTNDKGRCKLVLTLACDTDANDKSSTVTRHEATVVPGKSTNYGGSEFGCTDNANAMTFKSQTAVARTNYE